MELIRESNAPTDKIEYAHSAAVVEGQAINKPNFGPIVAERAHAINTSGVYYTKGFFYAPIQTAVTITDGEKVFYRPSTNKVVDNAAKTDEDFFLGTAIADGTEAAGYVLVDLNRVDTSKNTYFDERVIDEVVTLTNAVETNLSTTLPAYSVVKYVLANLDTAITGDGSGDDGLTKVGIGITADPNKYGLTADLAKNTKINTVIASQALLTSAETVTVKAADNAGDAVTEKFVAGGLVHVRIVYDVLKPLDDAA